MMKTTFERIRAQASLLAWVLLGLGLAGCQTTPPAPTLPAMGSVVVIATSAGGKYGEEGNNGSAIGAAEQAFTEVLVGAGFKVVARDPEKEELPEGVTHKFQVVVNQASFDQASSSRGYQTVEVRSSLVDVRTREIVRPLSGRRVVSSKVRSQVIEVVGQVAREVATGYLSGEATKRQGRR